MRRFHQLDVTWHMQRKKKNGFSTSTCACTRQQHIYSLSPAIFLEAISLDNINPYLSLRWWCMTYQILSVNPYMYIHVHACIYYMWQGVMRRCLSRESGAGEFVQEEMPCHISISASTKSTITTLCPIAKLTIHAYLPQNRLNSVRLEDGTAAMRGWFCGWNLMTWSL